MALTAKLNLAIGNFRRSIKTAEKDMTGMGKHAQGVGNRLGNNLFSGLKRATSQMGGMFKSLVKNMWMGAGLQLGAGMIRGLANIGPRIQAALKEGMEQENLTLSFNALTEGDGSRVFEALRSDALRTGVEINNMATSVRKFIAQGMDSDGALKLNRSLLDIGGAVGMSSYDVGLLGNALAQVKAKGVAAMEELRQQIAERGVPVFKALRQSLNFKTDQELFKAIEKGKVSAEDVIRIFRDMEGPFSKFKGGAEKMATTLSGIMSRISQQVKDIKRIVQFELIEPLKPFFESILTKITDFKEKVRDAMVYVRATLQLLQEGESLGAMVKTGLMFGLKSAVNFLWAHMQGVAAGFGQYLREYMRNALSVLSVATNPQFWSGLKDALLIAGNAFAAILLQAAADVLRAFENIPGFKGLATKAEAGAAQKRDTATEMAKNFKGLDLDKIVGEVISRGVSNTKNIAKAYADAVKAAGQIVSTEQEAADLKEIGAKIALRAAQEREKAAAAEAAKAGKDKKEAEKQGNQTGGSLTSSNPRAYFAEIGALLGRSPEEALNLEMKSQTTVLKEIRDYVKPDRPTRPPVKQKNLQARFV